MKILKAIKLIFLNLTLFSSSMKAQQTHIFNTSDTFYYFQDYDYFLNIKERDTSLKYLKVRMTDVEKLSGKLYEGEYDFASFTTNKKKREIIVKLFDEDENLLKTLTYHYTLNVSFKEDTWFFNLTAVKKTLLWKVIIPTIEK